MKIKFLLGIVFICSAAQAMDKGSLNLSCELNKEVVYKALVATNNIHTMLNSGVLFADLIQKSIQVIAQNDPTQLEKKNAKGQTPLESIAQDERPNLEIIVPLLHMGAHDGRIDDQTKLSWFREAILHMDNNEFFFLWYKYPELRSQISPDEPLLTSVVRRYFKDYHDFEKSRSNQKFEIIFFLLARDCAVEDHVFQLFDIEKLLRRANYKESSFYSHHRETFTKLIRLLISRGAPFTERAKKHAIEINPVLARLIDCWHHDYLNREKIVLQDAYNGAQLPSMQSSLMPELLQIVGGYLGAVFPNAQSSAALTAAAAVVYIGSQKK